MSDSSIRPENVDLIHFTEDAYLAYAMSTVTARALPSLADGQKPVQRRLLYAMREMGLLRSPKHVKSARVVGDVLGKFHPHGDSSAYEAMVRMAQDFSLRYPLVDGQGNFGSRDGDSAAAMRYTEIRLAPISDLLLAEVDEATVDFRPNYDGSLNEPSLLPARLPFLLLNGSSGIAVGMATEIPSHNLREVGEAAARLILDPKLPDSEILELIPGPDYPGGGQLVSSPETIRQAQLSGRGSLRIRASWTVETFAKKDWQLVITELPPGVSTAKVLAEIEVQSNPQLKAGKKSLTPEQATLKAAFLSQIDAVRDESGKAYAVRLVVQPKSRQQDPEALLRFLLVHTSLESNSSLNLTLIDHEGKAPCLGLPAILRQWVGFRLETVRRRSKHRLQKAEARIHLLEGRLRILLDIDAVIRVIREADDPKAELVRAFGLTEIQAEDILEIRLRQLARLASLELEKELAKLRKESAKLQSLLDKDSVLRKTVAMEIRADVALFGDARRTRIEPDTLKIEAAASPPGSDDPVTLLLSRNGWLRSRTGHRLELRNLAFREGDALLASFEVRQCDHLVILDNRGRAYSVPAVNIPGGRGDGIPATSQLELGKGATLATAAAGAPDSLWLFAGSQGYGFQTKLESLIGRNRAGKAFMTLQKDEPPLAPLQIPCGTSEAWVVLRSRKGRVLCLPLSEIKNIPRGKGVKLLHLENADTLAEWALLTEEGALGISAKKLESARGTRGGKGKLFRSV